MGKIFLSYSRNDLETVDQFVSSLNQTGMEVWDDDILVDDEAGYSEPSHGVIYLVEKHGYAGPIEIPWTAP